MSNLYEWFKSRNEETAINKTLVHMQKVLECVVEFEKGLSFYIEEKNIELALKVFKRVDELEHQADGIRRKIHGMLSQAELPSTVRETLIHLAQKIDDVANATNAGARLLSYMKHDDILKLEKEIHQKILEIISITVEAVKKLNQMVNSLLTAENVEIQKIGNEINNLEHKCDELRSSINRILVNNHPNINPFSAIEIHNFISILEGISDNAEDTADYIIMLTIAKKT